MNNCTLCGRPWPLQRAGMQLLVHGSGTAVALWPYNLIRRTLYSDIADAGARCNVHMLRQTGGSPANGAWLRCRQGRLPSTVWVTYVVRCFRGRSVCVGMRKVSTMSLLTGQAVSTRTSTWPHLTEQWSSRQSVATATVTAAVMRQQFHPVSHELNMFNLGNRPCDCRIDYTTWSQSHRPAKWCDTWNMEEFLKLIKSVKKLPCSLENGPQRMSKEKTTGYQMLLYIGCTSVVQCERPVVLRSAEMRNFSAAEYKNVIRGNLQNVPYLIFPNYLLTTFHIPHSAKYPHPIRAVLTVLPQSLWWSHCRCVKCGWYPHSLPRILPAVTPTPCILPIAKVHHNFFLSLSYETSKINAVVALS